MKITPNHGTLRLSLDRSLQISLAYFLCIASIVGVHGLSGTDCLSVSKEYIMYKNILSKKNRYISE
jgi:hypothetical protein